MNEDENLLRRWQEDGDQLAFTTLEDRYSGQLNGYARQLIRDAHLAEDVVQVAFLKLAQPGRIVPHGVRVWLYTVVHHACVDVLRRRHGSTCPFGSAEGETPEPPARDPGPVDLILSAETAARLLAYVEELPAPLRVTVTLHMDGFRGIDVAYILQVSSATVSGRLAQAVEYLRERFRRDESE